MDDTSAERWSGAALVARIVAVWPAAAPWARTAPGGRALRPAAPLLAVAVTQVVLARVADLSPWKGGGFGMFATNDGAAFRYVRLFVDAPGRSEETHVTESLEL